MKEELTNAIGEMAVKVVTDNEHLDMVKSSDWRIRREAVRLAFGYQQEDINLQLLIDDPEWMVRAELAAYNIGVDKLYNDEDPFVRMAVLQSGFLDCLFSKYSEHSNEEATKILLGFAEDPVPSIRAEVARQGFMLGKLVDDPSSVVRYQVAKRRYKLNQLSNDPDERVRNEAKRMMEENL